MRALNIILSGVKGEFLILQVQNWVLNKYARLAKSIYFVRHTKAFVQTRTQANSKAFEWECTIRLIFLNVTFHIVF
jgi:hypothetical protein